MNRYDVMIQWKKKVSVQVCCKYMYVIQRSILCQWTVFGHWMSQWAREKTTSAPLLGCGTGVLFRFSFLSVLGVLCFSHGVLCNFVVYLFILPISKINLSKYLAHYREYIILLFLYSEALEIQSVILLFPKAPESLRLVLQ